MGDEKPKKAHTSVHAVQSASRFRCVAKGGLPCVLPNLQQHLNYIEGVPQMMKRALFFPLVLLLATGISANIAYAEKTAAKKEASNVTKLIKTDRKLGKGEQAKAGRAVAV